jgi:hypothetical protein
MNNYVVHSNVPFKLVGDPVEPFCKVSIERAHHIPERTDREYMSQL